MASNAQPGHAVTGLVIRKTKLGETDLIVAMLCEDGTQVQCVAKGARKPHSAFAARLELFSVVRALLIPTKGLAVIREAELLRTFDAFRNDFVLEAAGAVIVDFLEHVTQSDLPVAHLYAMSCAVLERIEESDESLALLYVSAFLIKASSLLGYKPLFRECVECGATLEAVEGSASAVETASFSFVEGGVLCFPCSLKCKTAAVPHGVLPWVEVLLYAKFDEVAAFAADVHLTKDILNFCQIWVETHFCIHLKSLDYVLSLDD